MGPSRGCSYKGVPRPNGRRGGPRERYGRLSGTDALDAAARAAWLYYVARRTQDEIAQRLGVSRQAAQRLVARAVNEGLVHVRIDHPIANGLMLAARLEDRFSLTRAIVVPTAPEGVASTVGVAGALAEEIERWLSRDEPLVVGMGTGRTLKAAVSRLPSMNCPQHRIVSMTGSIAPDGTAAFYNVIFSMADRVSAPHYPLPVPVYASDERERDLLHAQPSLRIPLEMARKADVAFLGIGDLREGAPLAADGFVSSAKLDELRERGAVGEICGWLFDREGQLLSAPSNQRIASPPLPDRERTTVVGAAVGTRKRTAIQAALRGGLLSALITDEATAGWLIEETERRTVSADRSA